ncbi:hypothetical protein ASD44_09665 [Mesorhizobium sp. Root554]|uniref:hypothetical protein n=1 Tax=unclassified Mesorhizobium TaxID=325217 RepID=UPI0006FCD4D2|nr:MULTISPECIES: hypothetical protein [unclassified Mesorhizobium]KQZ14309.1 hypothetical protein ASD27_09675 [Mesorhizobium sp. Root1471]KQZ36820.1 hypothetical protein ASD44_09665 [Mesorhizobium sp. Root554]
MTALTADRNTVRLEGELRQGGMAASVLVYAGALVMRNAAGYLTKGATATGNVGAGRAEERKTGGAGAGDVTLGYRPGIYRYANSASTDLIGITEIGKPCYVVDDQTVAKTDGTGTRSLAGFVEGVDTLGVWVRFDEVAAQAYLAGLANPA